MATINIFVSFEFDKDNDLKSNFYRQAKDHTQHRIRDCSLKEDYPDDIWRQKARAAIEQCNMVIILIGQDTHNAPGVLTEVGIAKRLGKPIFQIKPQGRSYNGVEGIETVRWKWQRINSKIDELSGQQRR